MPVRPCPDKFPCFGPSPNDSPLSNYSSESPDPSFFIGRWHSTTVPRIGTVWTAASCYGTCTSTISQEEADLCAQLLAFMCVDDSGGGTHPPGDPPCFDCDPVDCVEGDPCTGGDGGCRGFCDGPLKPDGNPPTIYCNSQQSCSLPCPDGTIFTFTVRAGIFCSYSQILSDRMASSFACSRARLNRMCIANVTNVCCEGSNCNFALTVTGGSTPITWDIVSGSIPTGMVETNSLSGRVLLIEGIPTAAGNYTVTYKATDSIGNFMQKEFTLKVLGITNPTALANYSVGVPYSVQLVGAGGTGPYTFALTDGALPDGLTLTEDGLISGTPTVSLGFEPVISITDSTEKVCSKEFTITGDGCNPDATPALFSTIDMTGEPGSTVYCSGSNRIFVWKYNSGSPEVTAISAIDHSVVGTVALPAAAFLPYMTYDSVHGRVWVPAGSDLVAIDENTLSSSTVALTSSAPYTNPSAGPVAYSPSSDEVWCLAQTDANPFAPFDNVVVYAVTASNPLLQFRMFPSSQAFADSMVYISDDDTMVIAAVDADTDVEFLYKYRCGFHTLQTSNNVTFFIANGGPSEMAYDPNTQKIFLADFRGLPYKLVKINKTTLVVEDTDANANAFIGAFYNTCLDRIMATEGISFSLAPADPAHVKYYNPSTMLEVASVTVGKNLDRPSCFNPNNAKVYVCSPQENKIYLLT